MNTTFGRSPGGGCRFGRPPFTTSARVGRKWSNEREPQKGLAVSARVALGGWLGRRREFVLDLGGMAGRAGGRGLARGVEETSHAG
jgi:hypothetical protein